MSKAPSATASASSHDPHSLPPLVRGHVQRFLAVSVPTITLTPALIDALDQAQIPIPTRIQVTMRWWKEDPSVSLAVYPKLNSPLPPDIAARQPRLREEQRGRNADLEEQLKSMSLPDPADPAPAPSEPQPKTRPSKPWLGARLLTAIKAKSRARKDKKKDHVQQPSASAPKPTPVQVPVPTSVFIPVKPLPSLPEAALATTVAYPVRCSLDQLHRYFQEMASLTLEIQITPGLSALATVPSLTHLFLNINGTFSGVFPLATVLQNDDPRLADSPFFSKRVVLGMVVFQAWSQDTSDVGDSSEDSLSTGSLEEHHQHHPQHHHHRSQVHPHDLPHPLDQQRYTASPTQMPDHAIGHGRPHRHGYLQPSLSFPPPPHHKSSPRHPDPGPDPFAPRSSLRFEEDPRYPGHSGHRRALSRSQDSQHGFPGQSHRPSNTSSGPWPELERRQSRDRDGRYLGRDLAGDSTKASQRYPNIRIPAPDPNMAPSHRTHPPPLQHRHSTQWSSLDESLSYEDRRRSQEYSEQSPRSRPRSGATASVIGRLDTVLARGEELLHGMKTSLALDPEEVRQRSQRNLKADLFRESLPYWPTKSRFNLELSIPTAYLTSRGLLKGSSVSNSTPASGTHKRKKHSSSSHGKRVNRGDQEPASVRDQYLQQGSANQKIPDSSVTTALPRSEPSMPRQLRRSGRSIHNEKETGMMARLKVTQEQSIQPESSQQDANKVFGRSVLSSKPTTAADGAFEYDSPPPQQQHRRQESRHRRLSSHDRLQIRMNPVAADMLSALPDLFPARSMSRLVVPAYQATLSSRSSSSQGSRSRSSSLWSLDADHPSEHRSRRQRNASRHFPQSSSHQQQEYQTPGRKKAHHRRRRQSQGSGNHHAQQFDFQASCPLFLTPEIMAACMVENISVEVWKLNSKRQTMVELGSAKLPLHKVLSRILQKSDVRVHTEDQERPEERHPHQNHNHPIHKASFQRSGHSRQDSYAGHQQHASDGQYGGRSGRHFRQDSSDTRSPPLSAYFPVPPTLSGPRGQAPRFHGASSSAAAATGARAGAQSRAGRRASPDLSPPMSATTHPLPPHPPSNRPSSSPTAKGRKSAGGWRLEPTVYDIRSRQGTVIGRLDADLWIRPRERTSSMVSAAA